MQVGGGMQIISVFTEVWGLINGPSERETAVGASGNAKRKHDMGISDGCDEDRVGNMKGLSSHREVPFVERD